jgi:hypothetical protein
MIFYFKGNKFQKLDKVKINDEGKTKSLIASIKGESKLSCITKCSFDYSCFVITFDSKRQTCSMLSEVSKKYLVTSVNDDVLFYVKKV